MHGFASLGSAERPVPDSTFSVNDTPRGTCLSVFRSAMVELSGTPGGI